MCICNTAQFTFLEPENVSATGFVHPVILFLFTTEVIPTISRFNLGTKFQNTVLNNDLFSQKFYNINGIILKAGRKGCK